MLPTNIVEIQPDDDEIRQYCSNAAWFCTYMIHTTRYGTCLVRVLAASRPTAMSMHTTPNRTRLYFLLCKFNVWFSTNNVDNNTQQLRYDCVLDRKAKSLTFSVRNFVVTANTAAGCSLWLPARQPRHYCRIPSNYRQIIFSTLNWQYDY